MVLRACRFETERLLVKEWHSILPSDWQQRELAHVEAAILAEPVTRSLSAYWQGSYTIEREIVSLKLAIISNKSSMYSK